MEAQRAAKRNLVYWGVYFLVLALAVALLRSSLGWTFGYDQGTFAYGGSAILKGLRPYINFWDIKPPNIFYVYALAFRLFGESEFAVRMLDFINALLTLSLIWILALKLWRNSAWRIYAAPIASMVYVIQYRIQGYADTAQVETYSLPLIIIAVLAVLFDRNVPPRRKNVRIVCCGFLLALSFYFKFPNGIFLPFCMTLLWFNEGSQRERVRWIGILCLAFLVGLGLESAYLAAMGELLPLWNITIRSTLHYSSTNFSGSFGLLQNLRLCVDICFPFGIILALIGWTVWAVRKSENHSEELRSALLILFALLLGLIAVQVQNKGYKYHYQIVLPWAALLIGGGVAQLLNMLEQWDLRTRIAIVAAFSILFVGGVALLTSSPFGISPFDRMIERRIDSVQNGMVRYVNANTNPSDSIFIFGFEPYVYWASKRSPATRFLNTIHFKPSYVAPELRNELVYSLTTHPPKLMFVEQDDHYTSQGDSYDDSRTVIQKRYPQIEQLLLHSYVLRDTLQGGILAFVRN